jgi:hypothetical protein
MKLSSGLKFLLAAVSLVVILWNVYENRKRVDYRYIRNMAVYKSAASRLSSNIGTIKQNYSKLGHTIPRYGIITINHNGVLLDNGTYSFIPLSDIFDSDEQSIIRELLAKHDGAIQLSLDDAYLAIDLKSPDGLMDTYVHIIMYEPHGKWNRSYCAEPYLVKDLEPNWRYYICQAVVLQ